MDREELKNICNDYLLEINNTNIKCIKDKTIISNLLNYYNYNSCISKKRNNVLKEYFNCIIFDLYQFPVCECGNPLDFVSKDKASIYITKFGGWREFCCISCMQKSKTIQTRKQNTNIIKYGETSYAKTKEFKEKYSVPWSVEKKDSYNTKRKNTSIKKYGVEHFSKTNEYLISRTETNNILYGVDNTFQLTDKVINGKKLKYDGKISWLQTDIGIEHLKNSNPMFDKSISLKSRNNRYKSDWITSDKNFVDSIINSDIESFIKILDPIFEHNNKNKQLVAKQLNIGYSTLCRLIRNFNLRDRYISPNGIPSLLELEVLDFIKTILPDCNILHGDRSFLENKQELDILIPDYKLAIEFDGIYYHSEFSGDKDYLYHVTKTNICESKGVQLLHIFENEWTDPIKNSIWKSIIKVKLNLITSKIYARKCIIKDITSLHAKEFLNNNHLQGFCGAKFHKGLFYNDELVCVMSISNSRFSKTEYEIIRFATKQETIVVGAMSKLLKSFDIDGPIVSYADRRYSSTLNSSYTNIFNSCKITRPSWFGFHKSDYILYHRLNFVLSKFKYLVNYNNSKNLFDNMLDNGYDRIWDCGTIKFYNT